MTNLTFFLKTFDEIQKSSKFVNARFNLFVKKVSM